MPIIYALACTECDNSKMVGFINVPFDVRENGERKNLPHPGEDRAARHLTGLSVRNLRKRNRIGQRDMFVCERCLKTQLFASDEILEACPQCAHTELLAIRTLLGKTESHMRCAKCRNGSLVLKRDGIA